jgi:hypothetical protein
VNLKKVIVVSIASVMCFLILAVESRHCEVERNEAWTREDETAIQACSESCEGSFMVTRKNGITLCECGSEEK